MTLFGSWSTPPSAIEARELLAQWTAALPERLVWFRGQVPAELSDLRLDQLDELLVFVAGARSSDGGWVGEPPVWWTGAFCEEYTPYGAALADGLMAVITDIVQRRTGAQWELENDSRYDFYRQPVLDSVAAPPWRQVFTGLARLGLPSRRPFSLRTAVEPTLASAVSAPAQPGCVESAQDVCAEVFVSRHPVWDLRVALTEGASELLPSAVYEGFEDLLRSVPGVLDAMGEDREEFLVRTDGTLDAGVLEEHVNSLLQV